LHPPAGCGVENSSWRAAVFIAWVTCPTETNQRSGAPAADLLLQVADRRWWCRCPPRRGIASDTGRWSFARFEARSSSRPASNKGQHGARGLAERATPRRRRRRRAPEFIPRRSPLLPGWMQRGGRWVATERTTPGHILTTVGSPTAATACRGPGAGSCRWCSALRRRSRGFILSAARRLLRRVFGSRQAPRLAGCTHVTYERSALMRQEPSQAAAVALAPSRAVGDYPRRP